MDSLAKARKGDNTKHKEMGGGSAGSSREALDPALWGDRPRRRGGRVGPAGLQLGQLLVEPAAESPTRLPGEPHRHVRTKEPLLLRKIASQRIVVAHSQILSEARCGSPAVTIYLRYVGHAAWVQVRLRLVGPGGQ